MKVYAVLGSAPLHMGQPIMACGVTEGLVSFYDYPKGFPSLRFLNEEIRKKLKEKHPNEDLPSHR